MKVRERYPDNSNTGNSTGCEDCQRQFSTKWIHSATGRQDPVGKVRPLAVCDDCWHKTMRQIMRRSKFCNECRMWAEKDRISCPACGSNLVFIHRARTADESMCIRLRWKLRQKERIIKSQNESISLLNVVRKKYLDLTPRLEKVIQAKNDLERFIAILSFFKNFHTTKITKFLWEEGFENHIAEIVIDPATSNRYLRSRITPINHQNNFQQPKPPFLHETIPNVHLQPADVIQPEIVSLENESPPLQQVELKSREQQEL